MTKAELLEHIDEGIRTEESATALYLKHMDAIVTRSGRPNHEVEQMRGVIAFLVRANRHHKELLEGLRQQIEAEDINVY